MMHEDFNQLSSWRTVRLLLGVARKRSQGRRQRQQELFRERSGGKSADWSGFGFRMAVLFMVILNVMAAFVLREAVGAGQRAQMERDGKIVVSRWFLNAVNAATTETEGYRGTLDEALNSAYSTEAKEIAENYGGDKAAIEAKLRSAVRQHGAEDLITKRDAFEGLYQLPQLGRFPAMLGFFVLALWGAMLVFQGEGLELDLQRRRHPMWEWLFSHPVKPGPVFLAEMLSPIAANPIYWGAPLFAGIVYGLVYGPELGFAAAAIVGIPITIAAACLGKALEIGVTIRFPPRSRGAMIGLMSWMGYASMMLFFVGLFVVAKIATVLGKFLYVFTVVPWPWLGWFLGQQPSGGFSFAQGVITCLIFSGMVTAAGVFFSIWGANRGLAGNFGQSDAAPSVARKGEPRFGREPLYRKEFLWFIRDRSAVVQAILIPLTVAGFQLFNLRGVINYAQGAWNYLCGVAILFGTYFLWVLGPKSLSSEGNALWIALTWPRGLESLLKAKAWLWSLISTALVALVLCYAAYLFPHEIWKIVIVGVAWFFFGRSMAEKSVTLVTVASSSGEQEKVPSGRRWAAQLGTLTFAIGVLTQQGHVAVMGIVYSYITAAAMWQNFRAHLPYLYDPWSEKLPQPPTLMHAMIAISILVEAGAAVSGIIIALAGRENLGFAMAMSYGICAVAVSVGMWNFLDNRGVSNREVWRWDGRRTDDEGAAKINWADARGLWLKLVAGAAAGVVLGLLAHGYSALLLHIPSTAELIRKSAEEMSKIPDLRLYYAIMAVGFAPFAEEYLFRGLLFKALDREWGGWRAVVGSAAFFAVYHPMLSWPPVFLLGAANAILFKKTGRLAPAVALHMIYNAVVLF